MTGRGYPKPGSIGFWKYYGEMGLRQGFSSFIAIFDDFSKGSIPKQNQCVVTEIGKSREEKKERPTPMKASHFFVDLIEGHDPS